MILDTVDNAGLYLDVHPLFPEAFEFLSSIDRDSIDPGVYEIRGRELYVIVSRSSAQPEAAPKLEAHRKYIDLQVTLRGRYDIGWRSLDACKNTAVPYDGEKDIVVLDDAPECWLALTEGRFAVFFPEDAHAPRPPEGDLVKAIFKIAY